VISPFGLPSFATGRREESGRREGLGASIRASARSKPSRRHARPDRVAADKATLQRGGAPSLRDSVELKGKWSE